MGLAGNKIQNRLVSVQVLLRYPCLTDLGYLTEYLMSEIDFFPATFLKLLRVSRKS